MNIKRLIIFMLLFAFAGYFRERFFEHMNIILASVYRGTDEYANLHITIPLIMKPFRYWSYPALYYSKYVFTFLWTVLFFLLSYYTINYTSSNKIINKYLVGVYLSLIIIAGLSMGIGYIINSTLKNDEYTLSRWLLGIAQSPIICLILLAAENLYTKSFYSHHKNKSL
ncbi:MAG: hypothetical protein HYX39_04425 [Bacteroidetes bacterium]|nr:hypothetical protein [Bacteroidota bacterium]